MTTFLWNRLAQELMEQSIKLSISKSKGYLLSRLFLLKNFKKSKSSRNA